MDICEYKNIIFDFDGVIIDSNLMKRENMRRSAKNYCDRKRLNVFLTYFVNHNGIPREIKVSKFFDTETSKEILGRYNQLNAETLPKAGMIKGFNEFLRAVIDAGCVRYVASGGDKKEVEAILEYWNIADKFKGVYGGPKTKEENIRGLKLEGKTLLVGDSQTDFEMAQKFEFDFIFIYGYTQFRDWNNFFRNKSNVEVIKDFEELMNKRRQYAKDRT